MRKIIVSIIVIGLLLTTSTVSVNAVACRPYIYVDDDNTEGPWDGTQEHPYQFIQDGIDNANDGDVVFVFSGTYYETPIVGKSITFIGEDKNTTVVDGERKGHVVQIFADQVSISGFTVKNCTDTASQVFAGIYVEHSNHITIKENILEENGDWGVKLFHSNYDEIKANIFRNNDGGITVEGSSYSIFSHNYFTKNLWAFCMSNSNNNTVFSNTVNKNDWGLMVSGLYHTTNNNNTVFNNTVISNTWGLSVTGNNNTVFDNTVNNNDWGLDVCGNSNTVFSNTINHNQYGLMLTGNNNTVFDNTVNHSTRGFILEGNSNTVFSNIVKTFVWGFIIGDANNNHLYENRCIGGGDFGLCLGSVSKVTQNNVIENCTFHAGYIGFGWQFTFNNTVRYCNIRGGDSAVEFLAYCHNNSFYGNNIRGGGHGFYFRHFRPSNNNSIINNDIFVTGGCYPPASSYGIKLNNSFNNTIIGNNIRESDYGIYIDNLSYDNTIYHNNFVVNTQNAYDNATNIWDDGYPSGGSYWDDYTGSDSDGDGIGDTPYNISGGTNQDLYPLMGTWDNVPPNKPTISGPASGEVGEEYDYTFVSIDPDGGYVWYYIDWGDGDFEDWFGPYLSGEEIKVSHTWNSIGDYEIKVKAKDILDNESNWSDGLSVHISAPPDPPEINGPINGMVGEDYDYKFVSIDPEGDDIAKYTIDWDDDSDVEVVEGPFASGEEVIANHTWSENGTYLIRAKAMDIYGAESDWGYLYVTMPVNQPSSQQTTPASTTTSSTSQTLESLVKTMSR